MTTRAVVLAGGLGTRMRQGGAPAATAAAASAAADRGLKAMVPVGRPLIDYILNSLADAGFAEACIVTGPAHDALWDHLTGAARPSRIAVTFALQPRPLGTADAVLAAESFTRGEPFLVINSDNYYPHEALDAMRRATTPALAAFGRAALLADGQIAPERIAAFALLEIDQNGWLRRIVEKPDPATLARLGEAARVSMNCWVLDASIFRACRSISLSARGELELPSAVQYAIDNLALAVRAIPVDAPVLDLSTRADIATVAARLAHLAVAL